MANELLYNGVLYDARNYKLESEIDFWLSEANESNGEVLELCCGTGRVAIPIAKTGRKVSGVDISDSMLSQAKKKAGDENIDIEWIKSDIREFDLEKKFGMIYIPFNSFLHLQKNEDAEKLFKNVKKHLAKDGKFYLTIFNPDLSILSQNPLHRRLHDEIIDPDSGEKIRIEESVNYDKETQINHVTLYFKFEGGIEKTEPLDIRIYYPQEIDTLLKYNGFKIESKFGDYKKSKFTSDSPFQIFKLSV
ncbi:MAG: class I SAM-dependent methyltransferase [Caldisericia bacterium]